MEKEYQNPENKNTSFHQRIPVEYVFVAGAPHKELSEKESGYITNISSGGVLLEVGELNQDWIDDLTSAKIKVALEIKIPIFPEPVKALGKVAWIGKRQEPKGIEKNLLVLNFTDITGKDRERIREYVRKFHLEPWRNLWKDITGKDR